MFTVHRIIDGDTIVVANNTRETRIRIIGIDTPESVDPRQPVECYALEASERARELLPLQEDVSIELHGVDKYDRELGYITLADGNDFGAVMISEGYAYAYRNYPHDRMDTYTDYEQSAREARRGLWSPDTCLKTPQSTEVISSVIQGYLKHILWVITQILYYI